MRKELRISFSEPEKQEVQIPVPVQEPVNVPLTPGQRWGVIIGSTVVALSALLMLNNVFQEAEHHAQEKSNSVLDYQEARMQGYNACRDQFGTYISMIENQAAENGNH